MSFIVLQYINVSCRTTAFQLNYAYEKKTVLAVLDLFTLHLAYSLEMFTHRASNFVRTSSLKKYFVKP